MFQIVFVTSKEKKLQKSLVWFVIFKRIWDMGEVTTRSTDTHTHTNTTEAEAPPPTPYNTPLSLQRPKLDDHNALQKTMTMSETARKSEKHNRN